MNVLAICAEQFAESTRQAAGVEPLLSPPLRVSTFDPGMLFGRDLIYIDLHGAPGEPVWHGDDGPAISADQIRTARLGGAVVFALSCYLADDNSPMLDALLAAGASYVVGGTGKNYALARKVIGAGLLGMRFRKEMERGRSPLMALTLAKSRVRLELLGARLTGQHLAAEADLDTLGFRAYQRKKA